MLQFEPKNTTLKHLKQAVVACKVTPNTGPFKNDTLALVGSFYESPFIPTTVLSAPQIKVSGLSSDTEVNFSITLKPLPTDLPKIEQLETFLQATSMGYIFDKPEVMPDVADSMTPTQLFLSQNSQLSEIQDYELFVTMNEPTVTRVDTVINGVRYWQYKVSDKLVDDGKTIYEHAIYLLFKEKESDGETFYSSLVGKSLNKRDSKKVLDMLSGLNLTGLFIGGLVTQYNKAETRAVKTSIYSIGTEMELVNLEDTYIVKSSMGTVGIDKDRIESVRVERVGNYKYNLHIQTTKEDTTLFIG